MGVQVAGSGRGEGASPKQNSGRESAVSGGLEREKIFRLPVGQGRGAASPLNTWRSTTRSTVLLCPRRPPLPATEPATTWYCPWHLLSVVQPGLSNTTAYVRACVLPTRPPGRQLGRRFALPLASVRHHYDL